MKLTPKQHQWLLDNNKTLPIKCKMCDNIVKWNASKGIYKLYCSNVCYHLDKDYTHSVRQLTKKQKYNNENFNNQQKRAQTNLEKYGHENIAHGIKKEKVTQTMLDKYGCINPSNNHDIKNKKKYTNIKNRGVDNPFKCSSIITQIHQTMLDKYGCITPQQNNSIKDKTKQTNLKNHQGVHNTQSHLGKEIVILLNDPSWLFDQYINQSKTASYISTEIGVKSSSTVGIYLRKFEINIRKLQQSFISKVWLQSIQEQEQIEIIYEYQWDKNNLKTKADGYCVETNTIYEFHGDYWHGNPKIYASDIIHPIIKKTMGELYRKTIEREERIKLLGYNLVVMWEANFI